MRPWSASVDVLADRKAGITQKTLNLPDGIKRPTGGPRRAEQTALGEPVARDGADAERAPGLLAR